MRLLIVDDEPIIRKGIVTMAASYKPSFEDIQTAESGIDALNSIRLAEPDILITDIRMPKMDGLELCRIIHEQYSHIQAVVISGYNDFEYAQKCMSYGVKHYLLKPVTKSDVHEVLDQLIQDSKGFIPVSRYVEWMDQVVETMWMQQKDDFSRLLKQWRAYCLAVHMPLAQLNEFLSDCYLSLLDRFQSHHFTPVLNQTEFNSKFMQQSLDQFEKQLQDIFEQISRSRTGVYKDPVEEAKAYIDSKLSTDITLEEVATMIGLTPTYFSALFKKTTGETFVRYRINKRMEKAKEMLAIPHVRIIDVAVEVGYDDYPHFTKSFKKWYGISPSEYRSQLGIK